MKVTLNHAECNDLIERASAYIGKMYPIKELINGKNVMIDYKFKRISKQLAITELQKGEKKPPKFIVWAFLESKEKKTTKELLRDVVKYFEGLSNSN